MPGATGLVEPVAPAVVVLPGAVVVVVDAAGLLLNSDPAPRDGAVAAVVVLVEAGAVAVAGVLLKKLWIGAVDVVDAGTVGLFAPAAGGLPKRFEVVEVVAEGVVAALGPPNKFEVGAVGPEAAVGKAPPPPGFCAAVPAPPKTDGVVVAAVVGAVVGVGVIWAPPKRFDLTVVGVEAAPNKLLMGAVVAPPPRALLVIAVGAAADLAGPPKIFSVPAVFPKNPGAGVDPALVVENKLGEAAVVLSAACVVAAAPNIGTTGFAASAVGVAGFSPPAEELLNIPPVEDEDLFAPKIPGLEAAAGVVAGFGKVLDPVPNNAEPPVAPPRAVVVPLVNVDVLVVGVEA